MNSAAWIRAGAWLSALCPLATSQTTTPVSVSTRGLYPNDGASHASISGDGRLVAFTSISTDLVDDDSNLREDIFVHDRSTGVTTRVNLGPGGEQLTHFSTKPTISTDGRWVVYQTASPIVVAGDTNGRTDVFVHDRDTGATSRASVANDGSQANNDSFHASISRDGRYVAFESDANNLVPNDLNGDADLFVRDTVLGTTELASVAFDGSQSTAGVIVLMFSYTRSLSDDGRYAVFASSSSNLVPGDTNGEADVFLRDRVAGTTERVSLTWNGGESNDISWEASVSADGNRIAFKSFADNMIPVDLNVGSDIFVRDRLAATTFVVNVDNGGIQKNGAHRLPRISPDGRFVAFSTLGQLVQPDTNQADDVFVRDLDAGTTIRVSDSTLGVQSNLGGEPAWQPFSDDGQAVLFESGSNTLSPGIWIPGQYVFVRQLDTYAPAAGYCTAKVNSLGCTPVVGISGIASISGLDALKLTASAVLDHKPGIFFWGHAPIGAPFQGGWLCVQPPTIRTPVEDSGGVGPSPSCVGAYSFHFDHAYMASKSVGAGQTVYGQFWSRDPGFAPPNNVGLSNGIRFTTAP